MFCRKIISLSVCFFICSAAFAQLEDQLENVLQDADIEEFGLDTYGEERAIFLKNPIDLNQTNQMELASLQVLTTTQIDAFLKYTALHGRLIALYELQVIPGFDTETIKQLLPYVKIKGSVDDFQVPINKLISDGDYQFYFRYSQKLPQARGFDADNESGYQGNASQLYFRYRYTYSNRLSYGITAEKDAGETFFKANNKQGFDFYSFHAFWRGARKVKAIALGDYQVKMGQGLTLWTGFGFGKSPSTMQVKKEGYVLKPYTSVGEYLFLRGAATTLQFDNWQITPFISAKKIDANISFVDSFSQEIATNSIVENGYHRTLNEIEDKNQVIDVKLGGNIQYRTRTFHVGWNTVAHLYDKPLQKEIKPYNQFQFSGKKLLNTSLDYHVLRKSLHFFGETALSHSAQQTGISTLNGLLFNPDKSVDFTIVHRYYSHKYQATSFANAFSEATLPNNEHGVYLGTEISPHRRLKFNAYIDVYRFPWLKFQINQPVGGLDYLAQFTYKPSRKTELYIRYKNEKRPQNTAIQPNEDNVTIVTDDNRFYFENAFEDVIFSRDDFGNEVLQANESVSQQDIDNQRFVVNNSLQKLRFNLKFTLEKNWTFQSRAEFAWYHDPINGKSRGGMIFQDIKYQKMLSPISWNARIAFFDVQTYDARIYAYENDVLYQFSIPAFNNQGVRFYTNMRYKINKHVDVWARLAHTHYTNISSISSGQNEVENNHQTELKLQMRVKF